MPIFTPASDTQHELIPIGKHSAVLADIVVKPNCETVYGPKTKIQFRFQVVDAFTSSGERMMAFWTVNSSSAKKSALWEGLEMWLGHSVPVERRPKFDLETLIGKPAEIHIVHPRISPGTRTWTARLRATRCPKSDDAKMLCLDATKLQCPKNMQSVDWMMPAGGTRTSVLSSTDLCTDFVEAE